MADTGIPTVSIVISSYNYGRFLNDCIDSALHQTYPRTEVVVVDDASTDDSREIIAKYGSDVVPVLRDKNKGGRETYNVSTSVSRGDIICILDSDDMLCPTAVEESVALFGDPEVVKVHWPLWRTDSRGWKTGKLDPGPTLPDGDFREAVVGQGPLDFTFSPTSGNAYRRQFLSDILPVPPGAFSDAYLAAWALVRGKVRAIRHPMGYYRSHGQNNYGGKSFAERMERDLRHAETCCSELSRYYSRKGIDVNLDQWRAHSWYHRTYGAVEDIKRCIPEGDKFLLVDEDIWATKGNVAGRCAIPFPEAGGKYIGPPPDDVVAIQEVLRQHLAGAQFFAVAWHAFWWLAYYRTFREFLFSRCNCVIQNDRVVVFDLTTVGA